MAWWGWLFLFLLVIALYARSLEREREEHDQFVKGLEEKRILRELYGMAARRPRNAWTPPGTIIKKKGGA